MINHSYLREQPVKTVCQQLQLTACFVGILLLEGDLRCAAIGGNGVQYLDLPLLPGNDHSAHVF